MVSKLFNALAYFFWVLAGLLWVVVGLTTPGGMDRFGQPLNPDFYYEVGAFAYWVIGTAYLVPVGVLAGIGYLFKWIGEKFEIKKRVEGLGK